MPVHIVIGTQWGDEGKGRVVDWFASQSAIVARYAGGDNAGHTVWVKNENFKLHLVPSGIIHNGVVCVMGNGMVINPLRLVEELRDLDGRGIDISPGRVLLSDTAHMITPAHIALDAAQEKRRGAEAIGTTSRGIGPAYTDKTARSGLRMGLMRDPERLADLVKEHVERHNTTLTDKLDAQPVDATKAAADLCAAAVFLAPYLADTPFYLHNALSAGKTVLAEGAQGTLLDLDHGGYPYVTSSSAAAGGAITGLGIGPRFVARVTGVTKAFSTRVGSGPFPTEQDNEIGERLRGTGENPWDEFGTTTGRPRRCGWLDTVIARYAGRINGLTDVVVTKLDILSGFESLKIADSYLWEGQPFREMPTDYDVFSECEPVYESVPGWAEDITDVRRFEDLPRAARSYIERVETLVGVTVSQVTVGPARDQAIDRVYSIA